MKASLFILLFAFCCSYIPNEYKSLVDQALKHSKRKVPKGLREETKYPGEYEGPGYHFKLRKTFSSAYTNDIKGFASNEKNLAIVKRKRFNIKDSFVFVDPDSQTLYKLKKVIASEDNVIVYESSITDIFSVMTNFQLHTSSDENIPFNYSYRGTKVPRATIEKYFNWDTSSNKPILQTIDKLPVKYSYGASAKVGIDAVFSFNSIWDIKVDTSINFMATIGGEIVIPDDCHVPIPDKLLFSLSMPIPGISISKSFLGFNIDLGVFFNFTCNLTDMEVNIPIGFDYFKGYKLTGSKYFELTPNSISDSEWQIKIVNLPEVSTVEEIKKSILSASFKGTVNVIPAFSFIIQLGSYQILLQLGLILPFQYTFVFDTKMCMFPYLSLSIDFPFSMFYNFSGIKVSKYTILEESQSKIVLFTKNFGPFCFTIPQYAEGDDSFMQKQPETAYYIQNTDFYEESKSSSTQQYQKQIVFSIEDSNKIIEQKPFPYSYYSDYPDHNEVIFISLNIPESSNLIWNLFYKNSDSISDAYYMINQSFSKVFSNGFSSSIKYGIPVDQQKTDIVYFTAKFEKCEIVEPGKIFERKWNYIAFKPRESYVGNYSMIYFTKQGILFQNTCDYYSNCMANNDFKEDNYHYETDENYNVHLRTLSSTTGDFSAEINIYLNYKQNEQSKKILLGTYSTGKLTKNDLHKAEDIGLGDLNFNCYVPSSKDAFISIGGKIKYSKSTSTITEQIIYKDNEIKTDVLLVDKIAASFGITKVSPYIAADLYGTYFDPEQELLAESIIITPQESEMIKVHFSKDEMYKIIDITVPNEFNSNNNKYLLVYTKSGKNLQFLYDESRKTFNENCFYFYVSTLVYFSLPIRRNEFEEKDYEIQFEFFRCDNTSLEILNQEKHTTIKFESIIQSAFVIPLVDKKAWISWNLNDNTYTQKLINVDDNTCLCLRKYKNIQKEISVDFYLSYSQISELQPSITVNLSFMKPLLVEKSKYEFVIYSKNGDKIMAMKNDTVLDTIELSDDKTASFTFNDVGEFTFIPLCKNNNGKMCQISYEIPTTSGFHLIKYPNRDGISTTGAGFLIEAIPVISGQSFSYYKTYEEQIIKVKEYSNDKLKLNIKIEKVNNMLKDDNQKKRVCLHLENDDSEIIPFSRKYFSENMDELLEALSVNTENFDYGQISNDENGCLIFDANLISKEKINTLPSNVCDLPTASIVNPDYDPSTKTSTQVPTSEIPISQTSRTEVPITDAPSSKTEISTSNTNPFSSTTFIPHTQEPIISVSITSSTTSNEQDNSTTNKNSGKKTIIIIVAVAIAAVFLCAIIIVIGIVIYRKKSANESDQRKVESSSLYNELMSNM